MNWQPKYGELQEMSRSIMEERARPGAQGRLCVEPEGGTQEDVPPQPVAPSSGHMPAPGMFVISHTCFCLPPKYDGID